VQLENISWTDFGSDFSRIGEHRGTRIAYSEGILNYGSTAEPKVFIGDFVKILLDETGVEWISLGSTCFKQQLMAVGIEPDDCFVQVCADGRTGALGSLIPLWLAIEIDLTSRTQISAYAALKVSEVWCYDSGKLKISVLQNNYVDTKVSPTFNFPLFGVIPQFIKRVRQR